LGKVWHINTVTKANCDAIHGEWVANNDDQTIKQHGVTNHCAVSMNADSCGANNGTWWDVNDGICWPSLNEGAVIVAHRSVNGNVGSGAAQADLLPNIPSSAAIAVIMVGALVLLMHAVSTFAKYRDSCVRQDLEAARVQGEYQGVVDGKDALGEDKQHI
jgi:hypothetical protein